MTLTADIEACTDCGVALSAEEARYYLYRCECCEGEHHERIRAWQNGAHDPQLDRLYNNQPPRVLH